MTMAGKRLCLVGNGAFQDAPLGDVIDSYDIVVRFNNFDLGGARGQRTTHFASTFHKDVSVRPGDPRLAGLMTAFVGGRREGTTYEAWRDQIDEDWTSEYDALAHALGAGPSAGLVAFAWLLRQTPAEIGLVGFSFCQDLARSGNHAPRDTADKKRLYHNWVGEVRLFRELAGRASARIRVLDDPASLADDVRPHPAQVAVVIATCGRPTLLANRALPSVAAQTRRPDVVVVVDDSPWRTRRVNRDIVATWPPRGTRVVWLENWRSEGAAGAWNTALHYLHRTAPGCWVALLDDDDEWAPTYLERCLSLGARDEADIVVGGLVRRNGRGPDHPHRVPMGGITAADFLAGNPHWQGSNTFAKLGALLDAGGFDESFPSTNDRDLGLRLLDLPWLRWSFVDEHLVIHHADPEAQRLSSPGSPGKRSGLAAFYAKYGCRMLPDTRSAFLHRANTLFGVGEQDLRAPEPTRSPALPEPRSRGPAELLVGTISSPDVQVTLGFFDALRELAAGAPSTRITLVVLDNGGPDDAVRATLGAAVDALNAGGIVRAELLPPPGTTRASIAQARTLLQRGCYRVLAGRNIPIWLLDDDARFDVPSDLGDHVDWHLRPNLLGWIGDLRETGADVVIGAVSGEPPLPFASTVRVQIVDLLHNLEWMSGLAPSAERTGHLTWSHPGIDAPLPSRHAENRELRRRFRDYYYDLSRVDTGQLERPFWYEPRTPGASVGEAFREMVGSLEGIFAGRQVFRPLLWSPTDPSHSLLPGFHRGPNTLVFRPECLVELPNAAPRLAGEDTRRSDMNWALLGHHVCGWRVVTSPFPIRQDRSTMDVTRALEHRTLILDVRGYAAFSALSDVLLDRRSARQARGTVHFGLDLLDLTADELEAATRRTEKYLQERLLAWETSHRRVAALARALESFLFIHRDRVRQRWHFWLDDPQFAPEVDRLSAFVRRLRREFERTPDGVSHEALDFDRADLTRFFTHLRADLERFRASAMEAK